MAGNAVVGALRATLGLDSAAFTNGLDAAQKKLKDAGARMQKIGAGLATVGAGMSLAITAPFLAIGAHLLQGSQDAAHAAGQVKAALESMGGASGKTFEELSATAEALRNLTGVDDDEILTKLTANLLSFGNIAGDAFDRAQMAALNLSARMQGDLQGATMMIGKALNDPVKGLAALGRAGIQFTEQQKNQIKQMVRVGNAAGAQAIMLNELERQFGGAAEAAGNADIWKPMKTALMDLEGAFEPIVRDLIGPLIEKAAALARAFADLSPGTQKFIAVGAGIAAALGPALVAIGSIVGAIGTLVGALGAGGALAGVGAVLAPLAPILLPIAAAVAAVVAAFMLFKPHIMPVLEELWATLKETLGPPLQELFGAVRELCAVLGQAFKEFLASEAGQALMEFSRKLNQVLGTVVMAALKAVIKGIGVFVRALADGFRVISALLSGDWSRAWELWKTGMGRLVSGVIDIFKNLNVVAVDLMRQMMNGVKRWLIDRFEEMVVGPLEKKINRVKGFFFGLYDAVVGHSYIPDMVEGVAKWMAKLDAGMVVPALRATKATADAFEALRDKVSGILEGLMTERELLERSLSTRTAGLAEGLQRGMISPAEHAEAMRRLRAEYARDSAGLDAEGLITPTVRDITPLGNNPAIDRINRAMEQYREGIRQSREDFAEAFERGMDAALRGDWRGVLQAIFGDVIQNSLRDLGRSIFDSAGGGSTGGFGWGTLLKSLKIPGFARGGSFEVGGSGTTDSKLAMMKVSPRERVDVSTVRQQRQQGASGASIVHVEPSKYFDVRVQEIAAPMAAQAGAQAFQAARRSIPNEMARAQAYTRRLGSVPR